MATSPLLLPPTNRHTNTRPPPQSIDDIDVRVDLGAVPLRHALGDPDDVAHLLLLELHERVEHAEVELLHERVDVELDLVLEELVLEALVVAGADALEDRLVLLHDPARPSVKPRPQHNTTQHTYAVVVGHGLHLLVGVGLGEHRQSLRVELAAFRVEIGALLLVELGAETVDRDDEGAPVGLERENVAHQLGGDAAQRLAEPVEVLNVGLARHRDVKTPRHTQKNTNEPGRECYG